MRYPDPVCLKIIDDLETTHVTDLVYHQTPEIGETNLLFNYFIHIQIAKHYTSSEPYFRDLFQDCIDIATFRDYYTASDNLNFI